MESKKSRESCESRSELARTATLVSRVNGHPRASLFALVLLLLLACCKPTQPWAAAKGEASSATQRQTAHDLADDEVLGGHTLDRHVGISDLQLRQRLESEPNISAASTYSDRATADVVVSRTLEKNQDKIERWLSRERHPNLVLDYHGEKPVGRTMHRGERESEPCSRAIIVLHWDPPKGYHVLTSYPECR